METDRCRRAYAGYVVLTLSGVSLFNYLDRVAFSVLLPLIKQDFSLNDSQLGLLGFAFALFFAAGAIPIARWADRGVRRNVVALALAAWSVMTAVCGAAQSFAQLFVARAAVGVGEAGGSAPAASMICDYVPFQRRASALSIFALGNAAGTLLGMALAGWLGYTIGWRLTLIVLGAPGIILALVIRGTIKEPQRGYFDGLAPAAATQSGRRVFEYLVKCRSYRLLTLFLIANAFIQGAILHWMPSFYTRTFGAELTDVGIALGVASGVGFGIGMLAGGLICDRVSASNVSLGLKIGAMASVLGAAAVLAALLVPSFQLSIGFVFLETFLFGVANSPAFSHVYSVVPAGMRTTAGATVSMLMAMLGFGLGPLLVGILSDYFSAGNGAQSLKYALLLVSLLTPLLAFILVASAKYIADDLSAVRGHQGAAEL